MLMIWSNRKNAQPNSIQILWGISYISSLAFIHQYKTLMAQHLICFQKPLNMVDMCLLIHWDRGVTHICVIIVSYKGLSPDRRQAIIWTNAAILLIRPLGTKFSEMLIEIHAFSFEQMHIKMSSLKWPPFWRGFNMLTNRKSYQYIHIP